VVVVGVVDPPVVDVSPPVVGVTLTLGPRRPISEAEASVPFELLHALNKPRAVTSINGAVFRDLEKRIEPRLRDSELMIIFSTPRIILARDNRPALDGPMAVLRP
jgi:hypothetical protein